MEGREIPLGAIEPIITILAKEVYGFWSLVKYGTIHPPSMPPPAKKIDHPEADRTGLDSRVRVYAALLDQGGFNESFGFQAPTASAPAIAAFNALGECIGVANTFWNRDDDARIENGAHRDFTILQTAGPGQQIAYLQIYATGAPICIPGITMMMADNTPGAFLGDLGRLCGVAWYYSNIELSTNHQPDCFWLDSGVRNDLYTVGAECKRLKKQCKDIGNNCVKCDENDKTLQYQFPTHLRYLPKAMQYTVSTFSRPGDLNTDPVPTPPDKETLCGEKSLTFRHLLNGDFEFRPDLERHWDNDMRKITYTPPDDNPSFWTGNVTLFEQGSDLIPGQKEKRSDSAVESSSHPAAAATHAWDFYVSSATPEHSATQLCASITSLGPDFYSEAERKFCDMGLPGTGRRNLYDSCEVPAGGQKTSPCWDPTTHSLLDWKANHRKVKRSRANKSYTHKVEWKANGIKNVVQLLGYAGQMSAGTLNGTIQAPNMTLG